MQQVKLLDLHLVKTTMFYIKTNIQSKLKLICVVFSEVFWDALLMTSNRTRPSFLSSWLPWVCRRPCSLCYLTLPWTSSLPFLPHSIPFRVSPTGQPVSHAGDWVHAIPSRNLGIRQEPWPNTMIRRLRQSTASLPDICPSGEEGYC